MSKVKIYILVAMALILSLSSFVYAQEIDYKNDDTVQSSLNGFVKKQTRSIDGKTVYEKSITDKYVINEMIENNQVNILVDTNEVTEVIETIILFDNETQENLKQPRASYYIKNIKDLGNLWYFPNKILRSSTYGPGGQGTMTFTESVEAKVSTSVSVDASVVTAGVGFDVSESYSVSDSYTSRTLDSNERVLVEAWAYHNKKEYDIIKSPLFGSDSKVGTGSAHKPVGIRFMATYYK